MANNIFDIAPSPQRMPIKSTTEGAAPISTVAAASLIQEAEPRIRYYSKQMDIPMERFGIADGSIVYQTPSGELQKVKTGAVREFVGGLGASFPAVGSALGTVGGLLAGSTPITAPAAVPLMVAGGTTGAMTGQYLREQLASQMAGQRISPVRVATEGAVDLAASLTGALVGKGLSRAASTAAATKFAQAMKTSAGDVARALKETLDSVNAAYGTKIMLTPAELTQNAELIAMQKALAGDPRTAETMAQFAAERGSQIGVAASKMFEGVAPKAGGQEATGRQLATVAGEAVQQIKKQRSAAAAPAYAKAFEAGSAVNLGEFDRAVRETADQFQPLKSALNRLRGNYTKMVEVDGKKVPVIRDDIDLEYVQNNIKEILDDEISVAVRAGAGKKARRLQELQGKLLLDMDKQVPEYAGARAAWGDLSRPIDEVEAGILPILANKNIRDFEYMGARFLTSSSPSAIKQAKENIFKVDGGQDIWNATIRGALERQWEKASSIPMSMIARPDLAPARAPAVFWSSMVGKKEQLDRLRAAMSPDQMKAFENLTKVMEAASRAMYTGSDTAAKESAKEAIEAGSATGTAIKYAAAPWALPNAVKDAAGRKMADNNVKALADVLTRSDAVKALAELRAGQGNKWFNTRNMMVVGRVLGQTGMVSGELMSDFEDRPVGSIMTGDAPDMTRGMKNIFDL